MALRGLHATTPLALLACLLPCLPAVGQSWWDTSWTRRRRLTFDNAARPQDLQEFPVLVVLNDTRVDYARTQNAGEDLRFLDADDSTVLEYEIEKWAEGGTSYVWVRVPQIDASSAADHIWMYYGNSGASPGQQPANVWDSSYEAVYHLHADYHDSTGNANHGTGSGGPGNVGGVIADGESFDGANDYVDTGITGNLTRFTVSAWARGVSAPDDRGPTGPLMRQENYQIGWDHWSFGPKGAASLRSSSTWHIAYFGSLGGGTWYYLAATYDRATLRAYRNGSLAESNTDPSGDPDPCGDTAKIGRHANLDYFFEGDVDEVRIENVVRSGAWIDAQYDSMRDTLITYGPEETGGPQPPPGAFDLLSPVDGAPGLPLTPTLDWGSSSNAATYALVLDDDSDFSSPLVTDATLTASTYAVPSGTLQLDTTYYWQVTAINGAGTRPASNNPHSFTTIAELPPPVRVMALDYLGGGCAPSAPTGAAAAGLLGALGVAGCAVLVSVALCRRARRPRPV